MTHLQVHHTLHLLTSRVNLESPIDLNMHVRDVSSPPRVPVVAELMQAGLLTLDHLHVHTPVLEQKQRWRLDNEKMSLP